MIGVDPRPEHEVTGELISPAELDARLAEADFVVTTVPHTPETEGMWDIRRFKAMKSSAYFINIGRGMTTKLDDLVAALDDGEIAGAGLDAFAQEPPDYTRGVYKLPNVLVQPHTVASTDGTMQKRADFAVANLIRYANGEELQGLITQRI